MARGGKRKGAGRKPGSTTKSKVFVPDIENTLCIFLRNKDFTKVEMLVNGVDREKALYENTENYLKALKMVQEQVSREIDAVQEVIAVVGDDDAL